MKRAYSFSVIIWICRLMARKFQEMLPILISHSLYHINISSFLCLLPTNIYRLTTSNVAFFLFFFLLFVFWYIFLHVGELWFCENSLNSKIQPSNSGRPTRCPVHWPLDYWTKPWRWRARGTVDHVAPCMVGRTVVRSYGRTVVSPNFFGFTMKSISRVSRLL